MVITEVDTWLHCSIPSISQNT